MSLRRTVQRVTNEVWSEPALPQRTSIPQRPGVVRVPTIHVQLTRPAVVRFVYRPWACERSALVVHRDRAASRPRDGNRQRRMGAGADRRRHTRQADAGCCRRRYHEHDGCNCEEGEQPHRFRLPVRNDRTRPKMTRGRPCAIPDSGDAGYALAARSRAGPHR